MSTSYVNGLPELYGSSPKELYQLEARINEKLSIVYDAKVKPSSKTWSESSLDEFRGAKWTQADHTALKNLSEVWIRSLVEKDNLYKLPELTAYLALHFPQVDALAKPALDLLDSTLEESTVERAGFTDFHKSEAASGTTAPSSDHQHAPIDDYLQFRVWFDKLPSVQQVALVCFLAMALIRLCNESASEVKSFLQHKALDSFQTFRRITKSSLAWIPIRSLEYLQAYFQPGNQLLVTVLRPFLHLRDQLQKSSSYPSLLNALEILVFSPTAGKELHLIDSFQNAAQELGVTHEQLLEEMTDGFKDTKERIESLINSYDLKNGGTWQWARYFSREYFSDLQPIHNKKAANLLVALSSAMVLHEQEKADPWVIGLTNKYGTKRERASSASYEGFWDGARRIDYV